MNPSLKGRILALDVGDKRIGMALSDELGWTAQPLMTWERKDWEKDLQAIQKIIHEQEVKKMVVGLPMSLSEKITAQTQKVLNFIDILKKAISIPIDTWDESFTSQSAEAVLIKANVSRKKRKKVIDKLAAVLILQSYLEAHP